MLLLLLLLLVVVVVVVVAVVAVAFVVDDASSMVPMPMFVLGNAETPPCPTSPDTEPPPRIPHFFHR